MFYYLQFLYSFFVVVSADYLSWWLGSLGNFVIFVKSSLAGFTFWESSIYCQWVNVPKDGFAFSLEFWLVLGQLSILKFWHRASIYHLGKKNLDHISVCSFYSQEMLFHQCYSFISVHLKLWVVFLFVFNRRSAPWLPHVHHFLAVKLFCLLFLLIVLTFSCYFIFGTRLFPLPESELSSIAFITLICGFEQNKSLLNHLGVLHFPGASNGSC